MSKRDVRLFLTDMFEAIEKVERYTAGTAKEQFEESEILIDAVTRNLEVIGEAAKHIPAELRAKYSGVDWRQVAGFRDIAIHAYFEVDVDIVWTIATQRLADLKRVVAEMLLELEKQSGASSKEKH